jgi:hypothetical protein
LHVFGEAVLLGQAIGAHDAGDGCGAGEALLLDQQLERPVAPAAGRHLVHAGLGTALVQHRPDGQALQQRAAGNVLGQLLDRHAGLDAAHVGLAEDELVEGDVTRNAQGDPGLRLGHVRSPQRAGREPLSRPPRARHDFPLALSLSIRSVPKVGADVRPARLPPAGCGPAWRRASAGIRQEGEQVVCGLRRG